MSNTIRLEYLQPPEGSGASADPGATVAYIRKDERSPTGGEGEWNGTSSNYGFFDAPRAPGELGWLAHYRVRRLIGEGGMGLVFEAEDTDLLRPVALKVIRPELAGSSQIAHRFTLEARAMAAVKHDHIVTIYQVGQQSGVPFLAMEYLQGMSLQRWLDRGHKPSVDLVLRLGREIAAGLAAAHSRGLIHRDIKPANIWLEAPIGRVKILDFGLARSESQDAMITNPGTALGTPAYMAPEQARGEKVDASGDLFSLGCVLYQLCTTRLPFPGTSVMAVLTSLSNDTPSPPGDLNAAMPSALNELVMRLLAKNAADRPSSAGLVVDAIKSMERGLLAERQKAELPLAAPLPIVVDAAKPDSAGVGAGPGAPGPAAKTRTVRRMLAIMAAVLLLGLIAVSIEVVMAARNPGKAGVAAPAPVAVAAIGSGRTAAEHDPASGPPQPDLIEPPKLVVAAAETRTTISEARRGTTNGQAPGATAPDRDRERPEIPEKPAIPDAVKPEKAIETPADWTDVIDPDGDCDVVLDRETQRATIFVPGTAHLLSAEFGSMNAPRILGDIHGDFEVRLKVTGSSHPGGKPTTSHYAPYHGAGILVWQNQENYARLEIAAELRKGRVYPYANFELRQAGRLASSLGLKIQDGSSYLRLERRGDEIRAAFGPDGDHWTQFSPLIVNLNPHLKVGFVVVNSASKALKAAFDELKVTGKSGADTNVDAGRPQPPKRLPAQEHEQPPAATLSPQDHRRVGSIPHESHLRIVPALGRINAARPTSMILGSSARRQLPQPTIRSRYS